jgi:hypothetical protein
MSIVLVLFVVHRPLLTLYTLHASLLENLMFVAAILNMNVEHVLVGVLVSRASASITSSNYKCVRVRNLLLGDGASTLA